MLGHVRPLEQLMQPSDDASFRTRRSHDAPDVAEERRAGLLAIAGVLPLGDRPSVLAIHAVRSWRRALTPARVRTRVLAGWLARRGSRRPHGAALAPRRGGPAGQPPCEPERQHG